MYYMYYIIIIFFFFFLISIELSNFWMYLYI